MSLNFKGIFVSVSKVSLSFFFKYSASAIAATADDSHPFAELTNQFKNWWGKDRKALVWLSSCNV